MLRCLIGVLCFIHARRKRGTPVVFGVYKSPLAVDLNVFGEFKELNVLRVHLAPLTHATSLDRMARGLINGGACVNHLYPPDAYKEALMRIPDPDQVRTKAVLDPGA